MMDQLCLIPHEVNFKMFYFSLSTGLYCLNWEIIDVVEIVYPHLCADLFSPSLKLMFSAAVLKSWKKQSRVSTATLCSVQNLKSL